MVARAEEVRAAAVALAWAVIGAVASRATWHAVEIGPRLSLEVQGADIVAGRVALVAFVAAALIAGYTVLAAGPLLARTLAGAGSVAAAMVAKYAWDLRSAGEVLAPSVGGAGRSLHIRAGGVVAGCAALAIIASAAYGAMRRRS